MENVTTVPRRVALDGPMCSSLCWALQVIKYKLQSLSSRSFCSVNSHVLNCYWAVQDDL